MLYRPFGKLGWKVSAIGLGTWALGDQWGVLDDATAWATVRAAVEAGINLIDTAESYGLPNGHSEMRLGLALTGIRHQAYLISKIGHWGLRTGQMVPKTTVDMIRLCGHAICGRLRTDWVDAILCHEDDLQEPTIYLQGLETLKQEGRIRAYGISTNNLEVVKRFNREGTCAIVEVDYSLLNREPEQGLLPYCQEQGIAVLVRGPLQRGLLTGKYAPNAHFSDTIRAQWHDQGKQQARLERNLALVEKLGTRYQPGAEMVNAALRYITSHPAAPVAIPGGKIAGAGAHERHRRRKADEAARARRAG